MTGTPSPAKPASPAKPPSNQGSPTRSRSRSPARPASPSKDAPAAADSAPVAHPPSPKNKTPSPARPSSSPKPAVANGSSPAKEPASPVSKSLSLDHPAAAAASADVDAVAGVAGGDEATPAATEGKTSKRPRAAAAANGSTPATASRRASTAGARKSTGGRKSTAAASLVRKESYAIGDVVFAHVKGHPWWPARIVDDKDVPEKFLKERRATKEHCVMFYNSGQFGFVTDEYLVPLEPNHESLGTSAAIKKGIKEALEEPDSLYEILENYKRTDVHDEIADDDDDEHDRRASSSKSSSRKSASGKTPAKKAAKSAESTPARKRRAAAGDDDEVDGKKSKKSKGEATPSRSSKRKAGVAPTPTQDTLMRWRHLLQKTFIKDKQIGDKPRVSAETIHTVDWDGVKTTLDEFFEYVNGPEYSTEAVASTKLHKVVRLIANSSAVTDPDALLVEHDVPNKVNRLFEALRTRSEGSGNASGADAMDTAE